LSLKLWFELAACEMDVKVLTTIVRTFKTSRLWSM